MSASIDQAIAYYRRAPEYSRYGFGRPMYYVVNTRTALINAYNEHLLRDKMKPSFAVPWTGDSLKDGQAPKEPEAFNNTAGYVCISDPGARIWQLHPRELLETKYSGRSVVAPLQR